MLILDENNLPTNSVLYLASVASAPLQKSGPQFISELLLLTEKETGLQINSIFFSMAINFLFLIGMIDGDEDGRINVSGRTSVAQC